MEEKIQELFCKLRDIGASFLIYQKRDNLELVLWFLEGNRFGIEEELYQNMSSNLLEVLKDILEALEQEDMVLLHDAAANGLLEYLQLFVNTEQEDGANDNI